MIEINQDECIKNGYYCNGYNTISISDNMKHYVEKYDLDIIDICRKLVKATNKYIYSVDNVSLEDIDTLRVEVTVWYGPLTDFDVIRIKR